MKRLLNFLVLFFLVSLLIGCNGIVPPFPPPNIHTVEDYVGVWQVINSCSLNIAEIWIQGNEEVFLVSRFLGFGLCQGVGGTGSTTSIYIFKENLFEDIGNMPVNPFEGNFMLDEKGRVIAINKLVESNPNYDTEVYMTTYELDGQYLRITTGFCFISKDGDVFCPFPSSDLYEKIEDEDFFKKAD
ncbi:MAG: hypothetical protein M0R23_09600 [Bacteroidales bacterium]|jgi:hypothetical protein|nr:hypothetical protein [Bacteroidales bacterium]